MSCKGTIFCVDLIAFFFEVCGRRLSEGSEEVLTTS